MQARATPRMYFCVEVVRKLFADKPLKHSVRRKIEKKKEKWERKRCLKFLGVRGGFWQSSAEKWEGQRNYSLKDSLHKDANSCFSIRKDQRIEVRAKSFALHSPFARNIFVTWVSCEHGLCIVCSVLKQAATGDAWGSVLLGLLWLISGSSKSFIERTTHTCSSCALCRQASLNILPSHTKTASSDIKKVLVLDQLQAPPCHWLRTIWKGRAAKAFATTTDWRSDGVSIRRSTRRLDRRLSGTRTGVRVAESCAKLPTASRWWTRRLLKWCMTKLRKFSLQVTMVLWTLFRTRLTKKHLFQNR